MPREKANHEKDTTGVITEDDDDQSHADGEDVDVEGGGDDQLDHVPEAEQLEGDEDGGDDLGEGAGAQLREPELLLRGFATGNDAVRRHDADAKPNHAIS